MGHSSRGIVGPACRRFAPAPLRLLGASSVCGLVRKSPRLVCAVAVCWPPAPPWSRSRACLSWRWRGSPPAAGRVPALALASPPRWGALCGACRGAGGRRSAGAGGSYLPPSAPGLAQLLGHGACGRFAPCPLSPSPLRGAGERCGGPHIHPSCNFLFIFWREYDRSKPGCASAQSCGNWSQTWKTWWKTAGKWQET